MWTTMWRAANDLVLAAAEVASAPAGSAPADTARPQNPMGGMWLFFVAFIAIMYFLMIRPNQKREKERLNMLASLSKGDRVTTTGGVCGTIVGLNEKSITLRVCDDPVVKIEFVRSAVARVASREDTKAD